MNTKKEFELMGMTAEELDNCLCASDLPLIKALLIDMAADLVIHSPESQKKKVAALVVAVQAATRMIDNTVKLTNAMQAGVKAQEALEQAQNASKH